MSRRLTSTLGIAAALALPAAAPAPTPDTFDTIAVEFAPGQKTRLQIDARLLDDPSSGPSNIAVVIIQGEFATGNVIALDGDTTVRLAPFRYELTVTESDGPDHLSMRISAASDIEETRHVQLMISGHDMIDVTVTNDDQPLPADAMKTSSGAQALVVPTAEMVGLGVGVGGNSAASGQLQHDAPFNPIGVFAVNDCILVCYTTFEGPDGQTGEFGISSTVPGSYTSSGSRVFTGAAGSWAFTYAGFTYGEQDTSLLVWGPAL